jgi:hypothetical protein
MNTSTITEKYTAHQGAGFVLLIQNQTVLLTKINSLLFWVARKVTKRTRAKSVLYSARCQKLQSRTQLIIFFLLFNAENDSNKCPDNICIFDKHPNQGTLLNARLITRATTILVLLIAAKGAASMVLMWLGGFPMRSTSRMTI